MPGEHSGEMISQLYSPPPKPRTRPTGKKAGPGRLKSGETRAPEKPRSKPRYGTFTTGKQRSTGGSGTGGYGGGSTSNGIGNLSTAVAAAPSLDDFLAGDETYQGQVAAIVKAMANYRAQMGERTDEYNADFASRLRDLNLNEQRSTTDQADDYAGRGMYISGLYGKARGDLEQDFNKRESDMNMTKNQYLAGLNRDFVNFQEEQDLTKQRARTDAINRRALQYML